MAYVTPPTFTSGTILTATMLNTLSNNQEYLYGLTSTHSPGMAACKILGAGSAYFAIRHMARYLHVDYANTDDVRILYNGIEILHDGSPDGVSNPTTIDLNALSLTLGEVYTVQFIFASGSGTSYAYYCYEAES